MAANAVILHPAFADHKPHLSDETSLNEAVSLASALGLNVAFKRIVRLRAANGATLFGHGNCDSLKHEILASDAEVVVINGQVTPIQQRNLEREWKVKVLDRTGLILEIFASRARTREGVLQVRLAQLNYQKSRLVRRWTHLERQRGALGFVGGSGETQIESDRRAIEDQIVNIKQKLKKVVSTRGLHREARKAIPYPVIALVGYTNAGKSTLFNRLTSSNVLESNSLFATLDPTMRAVCLPSGFKVILSDTVGFISDLPTQLVAAFRATLEEVVNADLVVHVRDVSHKEFDRHAMSVESILNELGVNSGDSEVVLQAWNKIDLLPDEERRELQATCRSSLSLMPVSAATGEGTESLLAHIEGKLRVNEQKCTVKLSFSDGRQRAWLFEENVVQSESVCDSGFVLQVRWSNAQARRYRHHFLTE